ncbi:MAG: metalloregulator ArsR/SmtB family transcription factor [Clostridiales bacterium]|nr:metalloregulator ArsR/SmtB family transcription factor [Clostridiales bacterium]
MVEKIKLPHSHEDAEKEANILEQMPDDEIIATVSQAMKQLGDPSRLKIFWLLCHTEECVLDIADIVKMSSPAVSHHLRILKSAGLVTSRRKGKEMLYKASNKRLVDLLHVTIETVAEVACPR